MKKTAELAAMPVVTVEQITEFRTQVLEKLRHLEGRCDINQGMGYDLELLAVIGDSFGKGLPRSFTVRDTRDGREKTYT